MNIKLLTEHYLEFLSLKGGCTGLSESIHVKVPHCWKSRAASQICCGYSKEHVKIDGLENIYNFALKIFYLSRPLMKSDKKTRKASIQ